MDLATPRTLPSIISNKKYITCFSTAAEPNSAHTNIAVQLFNGPGEMASCVGSIQDAMFCLTTLEFPTGVPRIQ